MAPTGGPCLSAGGASAGRWAGVPCAELGVACRVTRGAGRGACACGRPSGRGWKRERAGPKRKKEGSGPRQGLGRLGLLRWAGGFGFWVPFLF